jgi:WhiB family redox-sensing transcriptional regulator
MLATLGSVPVTHTPRDQALITAPRWFSTPPPRTGRAERQEVSLGVWVVRYRQNSKPGSFDTVAELPDAPDAEPRPVPWKRRALCGSLPLELSDPLFFGTEDRQAPEDLIVAVETARRVCTICPVRRDCLSWALRNDMRYGVWGGTSGKQREKMRARLAAGASVQELVDEWL